MYERDVSIRQSAATALRLLAALVGAFLLMWAAATQVRAEPSHVSQSTDLRLWPIERPEAVPAFIVKALPPQKTYVFCGALDEAFCGGMRQFAREVGGEVFYYWQAGQVAADIKRHGYKRVRLAGQSCGGSAAVDVAVAVPRVKVTHLALFDSAQVFCRTAMAPRNVARVWSRRQDVGLGGARMQDRSGRVNERTVHHLSHAEIGFDAGMRRSAVLFFRS